MGRHRSVCREHERGAVRIATGIPVHSVHSTLSSHTQQDAARCVISSISTGLERVEKGAESLVQAILTYHGLMPLNGMIGCQAYGDVCWAWNKW